MSSFTIYLGSKNDSSWSLRAWLVLKQTRVSFEEKIIPLGKQNTHEEIAKFSPTGKVPVLKHNDLLIWDSLAICEYLAEQFPETKLWPSDRTQRAQARAISAEMHSGFLGLRKYLPMSIRKKEPITILPEDVKSDISRILDIWEQYQTNILFKQGFLFDHFTIADAMFAPVACRFNAYHIQLSEIANRYVSNILNWPTMKEWQEQAMQ